MAGVALLLARDALTGFPALLLCAVSVLALVRFKVNSTYLILLGVLLGAFGLVNP